MDTEVFSQAHLTIGYLLGGEYAIRFLVYGQVFAAFFLLEDYGHRRFGTVPALGTALIAVSSPLLAAYASHVNLEAANLLAAAVVLVVALDGLGRLRGRSTLLFFVLAAVGYLYKQQTAFADAALGGDFCDRVGRASLPAAIMAADLVVSRRRFGGRCGRCAVLAAKLHRDGQPHVSLAQPRFSFFVVKRRQEF